MEWQRAVADRATQYLITHLEPRRLLHSFGVVQAAVSLATGNGVNVSDAAIAGLLHDAAKGMAEAEMMAVINEAGLGCHPYVGGPKQLLHAPASAAVAKLQFGVNDENVLEAIAWHPTGKPQPSPLLEIILVADFCEPSRDFAGVEEVRLLARRNLRAAVREILGRKVSYVTQINRVLHPATLATLNSIKENRQKESD